MGTEWSSKINAKIADLAAQRDRWQREWRLLNAANIKAEERIKEVEAELTKEVEAELTKEVEAELTKESNRSILTATMIRENEHLAKENMRLAADCDGYRNGRDQLQDMLNTVMDSCAKLAAENKRLRAALGSTTDDAKPMCASLDTTGCKP